MRRIPSRNQWLLFKGALILYKKGSLKLSWPFLLSGMKSKGAICDRNVNERGSAISKYQY